MGDNVCIMEKNMDKKISDIVGDLIKKYNPEGVAPFPFHNIENDHDNLNITFQELKDDIYGLILFDKDKSTFVIAVNIKKSKIKQYFTIAHELGHFFLHKERIKEQKVIVDKDFEYSGYKVLFLSENDDISKTEFEASEFAVHLIMPEHLVREVWKKLPNIEKGAEIFHVSSSMFSFRLEELGIINS